MKDFIDAYIAFGEHYWWAFLIIWLPHHSGSHSKFCRFPLLGFNTTRACLCHLVHTGNTSLPVFGIGSYQQKNRNYESENVI